MTFTTALTLWGIRTIRRSFSITVEARELLTSEPYRFVRHPDYLGEMLTAALITVLRFSLMNMVILVLIVMIQLFRSKMEEDKLAQVFPAYSAYESRKAWLWPHRPTR